jgi:hypothetical protein
VSFNYSAFDPAAIPQGDFTPLPDGDYRVIVKSAAEKPTKDGTGLMLTGQLQVTEGKHAKRTVFFQINIKNKSQEATEIGHRELAAMMLCLGVQRMSHPSQVVGKMGVVKVYSEEFNGKVSNKVRRWLPKAAPAGAADPVVTRSTFTPPNSAAAIEATAEEFPDADLF